MITDDREIIRAQNFIDKCDFWFAKTAINTAVDVSTGAKQVVQRNDNFGDWINPIDTDSICSSSIIFCKFDYIDYLISYLQSRNCHTPFTLLTGQSDYPITDFSYDYVQSKISVKWWGVNNECLRAKSIPLGIADDYCNLTMKTGFEKTKGTNLLYVNHRTDTHPSRHALYDLFCDTDWATVRKALHKGEIQTYKTELLDHKFVLCPRGNGIDTHRMWEAIYCGVIPIVLRHPVHSYIEDKLPVLFVDSYEQVTQSMLEETYELYNHTSWNTDMLTVSWWISRMKHV